MPVTFNAGSIINDAFAGTLGIIEDTAGNTATLESLPGVLVQEILGNTIRIEGTGLTYQSVGGQTALTGGNIENVLVHRGIDLVGSFTGLNLSAFEYAAAMTAERDGTNPIALEELLFQDDFIFHGTDTRDHLRAGSLTDGGYLIAPGGDDIAYLYGGKDRFAMGAGDDIAYGGNGQDNILGGQDNDTLYGGAGNDILRGGNGQDTLFGNANDDILNGGRNKDILNGGLGADFLKGGRNQDILNGGAGDDRLNGGLGNDILTGGNGADTFIFSRGHGESDDQVSDFESGVDTLQIKTTLDYSIEDTLSGALITIEGGSTVLLDGVFVADMDLLSDIQFG